MLPSDQSFLARTDRIAFSLSTLNSNPTNSRTVPSRQREIEDSKTSLLGGLNWD